MILVETARGCQMVATAREIADDAWYSGLLTRHPYHRHLAGAFVEADRANSNGQFFPLKELEPAVASIPQTPLNLNHQADRVVGAFRAAKLNEPADAGRAPDASASQFDHPWVEAVAVFWAGLNPEVAAKADAAFKEGTLCFSMEAMPTHIAGVYEGGTFGELIPYDGPQSKTYPEEINTRKIARAFIEPTFIGGALLVPPVRPGWQNARIHDLAQWEQDTFEALVADLEVVMSLGHRPAMEMAAAIMDVPDVETATPTSYWTAENRRAAAKKGWALSNGSFPIKDCEDVRKAVAAQGRGGSASGTIRAHIKKHATALGCPLPDSFKEAADDDDLGIDDPVLTADEVEVLMSGAGAGAASVGDSDDSDDVHDNGRLHPRIAFVLGRNTTRP